MALSWPTWYWIYYCQILSQCHSPRQLDSYLVLFREYSNPIANVSRKFLVHYPNISSGHPKWKLSRVATGLAESISRRNQGVIKEVHSISRCKFHDDFTRTTVFSRNIKKEKWTHSLKSFTIIRYIIATDTLLKNFKLNQKLKI